MISIEHLEKRYTEDIIPLKDINAQINKGDVISLIGPSGTGKSTLLRCINMLEKPTAGHIIIDGKDITNKRTNVSKLRRKIGMVFQSFNLFSHKMVIENVMMGPMDLLGMSRQMAFDEGVKYLKMVGLGERMYAYPDELSGGQKQRVAIARCLVMKPEILLFDEPTSALDPTMVGEVQAVINKLASEGLTMMIISHDMKFSKEVANRVFYMEDGIIYEDGTPEQIFDNPKKEKTRAFVKRLKTLEYKITSKDFDLYELNAKIENFAKNYYIAPRLIRNTELVLEEITMNNIIKYSDKIDIEIRFFEADGSVELMLKYGGGEFSPFDRYDDDISKLLINRLTSDGVHTFDGVNCVTLKLVDKKGN